VAVIAAGQFTDDLAVMPDGGHVRGIKVTSVNFQGAEAFGDARLLFGGEGGFALKVGFGPVDEAFEAALKNGVIGGKVAFPRTVALFDAQRVQGEHAEGFQAKWRACGCHGVPDGGGVIGAGVDFPTKFTGEGDAEQVDLRAADGGGL